MSAAPSPAQPTAEEIARTKELLDALALAKTAATDLVEKLARYEQNLRETFPALAPSWSASPQAQTVVVLNERVGALVEEVMQLRAALAAANAEIAELKSRLRVCEEAT